MSSTELVIGIASILSLGIVAQWLSWKLVLPSILILLLFGFLSGPVLGLIQPDLLLGDLLFPLVSISVAIILFEGGLTLRLQDVRETGLVLRRLITVGALVTWVGISIGAILFLQLSVEVGILLGAVLVVSGPTVVIPLLRHVRPNRRTGSLLKWEGIVIDPIGALLALLVFEAISSGGFLRGVLTTIESLVLTTIIGSGIGIVAAAVLVILFQRYWVPDYLHNAFTLALVVACFAASNAIQHESGLFAVTVMGIALANQRRVDITRILEFKENLRVLLIGGIFILLAARLELSSLSLAISGGMLLFLAFIIVIVRPLAVYISSIRSLLSWRERLFIAFMAPRGIVAAAVSAIFGLALTEKGIEDAEALAPITFIVIVGTVLFYGLVSGPLARLLGVAMPKPQGVLIVGAHQFGRELAEIIQRHGIRTLLVDTNPQNVDESNAMGLDARIGSVLSDSILDLVELEGVGRMMALTSNDEVNTLAAIHFTERFGRSEIYQLSPASDSEVQEDIPRHLRGRSLFGDAVSLGTILRDLKGGGKVRTMVFERQPDSTVSPLPDEGTVPLLLLTTSGGIEPYTANINPLPAVGDTLVYLQPPPAIG